MMNAVAVIPARGGSKGIPRKNIRDVAGKPLLAWSIEAARGCPAIGRVFVSSDDDEILAVAKKFGAEPLKRPAGFATDTAGPKPVLQHALQEIKNTHEVLPHWVIYLQPTSPLRTARHLIQAFEMLEQAPDADALMSVYEIDNSYLKASTLDSDGFLVYASKKEFANMNRQILPKLYMPNGAIYIMRAETSLTTPRFDGEHTLPFVMSKEDSVDLDSPEDISPIEKALRARA